MSRRVDGAAARDVAGVDGSVSPARATAKGTSIGAEYLAVEIPRLFQETRPLAGRRSVGRRSLHTCLLLSGMPVSFAASLLTRALALLSRGGGGDRSEHDGTRMICGSGVKLCGTLALMTGLGSGAQNVSGGAIYGHPSPVVHGLWPQTEPYGDSACVKPVRDAGPNRTYSCYSCTAGDTNCTADHQQQFQEHEWGKHGRCAGTRDADSYFAQVCALAAPPLGILSAARRAGTSELSQFQLALEHAGFQVFGTMTDGSSQLLLSACADEHGKWVLAPQSKFRAACGSREQSS